MRTSRVGSRTFPLTQRYLAVTPSYNIQTRITPFPLLVPRQTSPTPVDYKKVTPRNHATNNNNYLRGAHPRAPRGPAASLYIK